MKAKTLSLVIAKIASLLENTGLGLIASALFLFVTGTVGNTDTMSAFVVGVVSYLTGASIDVANKMTD